MPSRWLFRVHESSQNREWIVAANRFLLHFSLNKNVFFQNIYCWISLTCRLISSSKFPAANWTFTFDFPAEAEIDDEGIERDSEEIDDEKFLDTKELDQVLEVSLHALLIDHRFVWIALDRLLSSMRSRAIWAFLLCFVTSWKFSVCEVECKDSRNKSNMLSKKKTVVNHEERNRQSSC